MVRIVIATLASTAILSLAAVPAFAEKAKPSEIISNVSKTRAEISATFARNVRG